MNIPTVSMISDWLLLCVCLCVCVLLPQFLVRKGATFCTLRKAPSLAPISPAVLRDVLRWAYCGSLGESIIRLPMLLDLYQLAEELVRLLFRFDMHAQPVTHSMFLSQTQSLSASVSGACCFS